MSRSAFLKLTRSAIPCERFTETPPSFTIASQSSVHHKPQTQTLSLKIKTYFFFRALECEKNSLDLFLFTKTRNPVTSLTIPSQRRRFFNSCSNLDRFYKGASFSTNRSKRFGWESRNKVFFGGGRQFPATNVGPGGVSEAERERI